MPDPIIGQFVIQRIAALALSQIFGWGMVTDSNGAQTDPTGSPQPGEISGWPDAYTNALSDWMGWGGSGLPFCQVGKQGFVPGYTSPYLAASVTGLPAHIQALVLPEAVLDANGTSVTSGFDQSYQGGILYVADGVNAGGTDGKQRTTGGASPIDTNHHYPFDLNNGFIVAMRLASFATGSVSQSLWPAVRFASGLTWCYQATANVSTVTGVNGVFTREFTVAAGTGRTAVSIEASILLAKDLIGPFASLGTQILHPTRTNGVVVSSLTYQGGLSGLEAATSVLTASDAALAELIQSHVYAQTRLGQNPAYVIQWLHGGNDRNRVGQASYNPDTFVRDGADSSTPAGVYNNCLTYYRRIKDVWTRVMGLDPDRLFLIAGPYMEQPGYESTLAAYEVALGGINTLYPRTCMVLRGTEVFNGNVWDDMNWFRGDQNGNEDTDDAHEVRQGWFAAAYAAVAAMKAAAMTPANALTAADLT